MKKMEDLIEIYFIIFFNIIAIAIIWDIHLPSAANTNATSTC